ncbi:LCP family protein [Streptomyces sp. NBC_01221]|uniref:LCP family protein n=1 Tax=unclassified Streptomyces TaxID=2593676 RepID=UPI002257DB94|nr:MULTISPECIES: LCP family protein [unclassified Streptomyces]WSP55434.1 LCP family protein [Streptomyces sp. NBC_01241]WSU23835.1 LCP family protein [Streptomyces sp. NBC_01108]MCX4787116.1 LCP family protein [Streptomyces sp. NBC_01221]MCX4797103.1 LCP family protein [Streptomyces sp. NBC_01242]WSJ38400.1 LCP family protein [Streptomyces sp. NBC_01321]
MGRSSTPGEGTRPSVRHAGQPGWDDGLYEDAPEPGQDSGADGRRPAPAGGGRHKGGAKRHGKKGKRRVLRWAASVLSLVIIGGAAAGYLYYEHLNGNLKKEDLTLGDKKMADHKANAAGQTPLNILLIGSDARDSKENQKLGGAKDTFGAPPLADVQMLVHLSADRSNMSVISMPRDTLLKIPKCTDPKTKHVYPATTGLAMTNETLRRGGPGCTVATWYELTGITIDHFMMIDFAGVVSMADAIGGVPVCVKGNVYSHTRDGKGSGLKLEEGTTKVKGKQALQWLRTRYGFKDGTDLSRTHAQHMYMNSMVRELRKGTKLTDPGKLMGLAEAATDALTVDKGDKGLGSVKKLYDLAGELKKVPTKRITMTTMPNVYGTGVNKGRVLPKPVDADQLFQMVRDDVPLDGKASKRKAPVAKKPTAPIAEIPVSVRNGTRTDTEYPVKGRASAVEGLLAGKGFTQAAVDKQNTNAAARTGVLFPSVDMEGNAQAVATALGIPLTAVKKSTAVSGITLTVGADWREDGDYSAPSAAEKTPESALALNGDDETACMDIQPGFGW